MVCLSACATMSNLTKANRICSLISQGQEQEKKTFTIKNVAWLEIQSKGHNKVGLELKDQL